MRGGEEKEQDVYPAEPDPDFAREPRRVILVRSANFQMHFRLQRLLNQTRYLKSAQKEERKRKREGDSSKADILEKCRKTVEGNANFHSSRH